MAINQNKYINIGSNIVRFATGQRDLSGLVITNATASATTDTRYANYNAGKIIEIVSVADAAFFFGASVTGTPSPLHEFAKKYFAYVSPNGRTPRHLYVMKDTTGSGTQIAADVLLGQAVDQGSIFGSFTFLDAGASVVYNATFCKDAYAANASYGNQFLAVHCIHDTLEHLATSAYTVTTTFNKAAGLHVRVDSSDYGAALPMAILASNDYNLPNSAQCFMYKQSSAESAYITTDADYMTASAANLNFYGLTQVNGQTIAFYQRGFNADGTDTGVYCNEIWLKSEIASRFFTLVTNVSKIPANYVGVAMVTNTIQPSLVRAINNGTVLLGKTLSEEKRVQIANFTGDDEAADLVEANGYWLRVDIDDDDSDGNYEAKYILVYSRGDAVRFVSGSHDII